MERRLCKIQPAIPEAHRLREREREREEPEVGGEGHQAAQGAEKNLSVFKVLFTEQ